MKSKYSISRFTPILFFTESGQTITSIDDPISKNDLVINVYPNPALDVLTIEMKEIDFSETISYQIINVLGQEKQQGALQHQFTQAINLSSLSPGCYILNVRQGEKQYSKIIWLTLART